ncbi:MAG: sigma-54-dependent Fis family transcriptional regulator [Deltaproteobacteria bacterium]|nr:sigma-54-dependent Fis family transcriptional regulator [Deltaproteobacteria bacterium]
MNVLIADDDAQTRLLLELYCRGEQFTALFAESGNAALERFNVGDIDVVVTDVLMPDVSGERVLAHVKGKSPETPVLIMTAQPTVDDAVRFLKAGADDYVTKPIGHEVFGHRLRALLERVELQRELQRLRAQQSGETQIIGNAPTLQTLLRRLPMTAQTDATVLITGDSGTGKELIARRIHELSRRKNGRFVAVNCGALSDTLLESELFGYKRGAFTDAYRDTPGLVEEAEGGTLFLDEIGEVSPAVQVKLLRFLQSKEYKALGSPKSARADVRIVAATNRDLRAMVDGGTFREDLYYRLNIVPVQVPALRERKADIPLLASHFLHHFRRIYEKDVRGFSPHALSQLQAYSWPGNVRELENRVQQLVVLSAEPVIQSADLSGVEHVAIAAEMSFRDEKKRVVSEFERDFLRRALQRAEGNMSAAARIAGIDRKNFWVLARRHGLIAQRGNAAGSEWTRRVDQ